MPQWLVDLINGLLKDHASDIASYILSIVGLAFAWFAIWLKAKTKIETQILWSELIKRAAASAAGAVAFNTSTPNDDAKAISDVKDGIAASVPAVLKSVGVTVDDPAITNIAKAALKEQINQSSIFSAAIPASIENK